MRGCREQGSFEIKTDRALKIQKCEKKTETRHKEKEIRSWRSRSKNRGKQKSSEQRQGELEKGLKSPRGRRGQLGNQRFDTRTKRRGQRQWERQPESERDSEESLGQRHVRSQRSGETCWFSGLSFSSVPRSCTCVCAFLHTCTFTCVHVCHTSCVWELRQSLCVFVH